MERRHFLRNTGLAALCAPFFGLVGTSSANSKYEGLRTVNKVGFLTVDHQGVPVGESETLTKTGLITKESGLRLKDLQGGDMFQMFEPQPGNEDEPLKPVSDGHANVFHADGEPYVNEDGVWTVLSSKVAYYPRPGEEKEIKFF